MPFSEKPACLPHRAPVPITFEEVLPHDSLLVADCLPYADMSQIPASFQAYSRWQHRSAGRWSWRDVCPAYALAYLTFSAYGARLHESFEWEIELEWDELRGESRLEWPHARSLLVDAWNYLGSIGQSA